MTHRFEGHNLEDALNNAASGLGVERYKLSHRIIVEKRGFLGGIKRVVIEAEVNENATPPAAPPPPPPIVEDDDSQAAMLRTSSYAAPDSRDRGVGVGVGAGGGRGRGARGARPGGERRGGGGGGDRRGGGAREGNRRGGRGGGSRRREESTYEPGDFERFAVEAPEQGPESEAAGAVRTWCEQVLSLAKLNSTIRTEENETQIIVRLYGGDARTFVDRHGELLDALQVLANKALVGRKVEKDIELDCESFKEKRVTDLEERAKQLADRVRKDGREQLLPAMSPIERRIVHLALQNDDEVTTESRGEGFYKRVAVILKSDAEPAES